MNILVVDDHPMTVEGYVNVLSGDSFGLKSPIFSKAYNCEEAYSHLMRISSKKKII